MATFQREWLPDRPILSNSDFSHPSLGEIKTIGMPIKLSETPASVRLPAPEFGQHTEEVLIDVLGYTWEQIAELREEEII